MLAYLHMNMIVVGRTMIVVVGLVRPIIQCGAEGKAIIVSIVRAAHQTKCARRIERVFIAKEPYLYRKEKTWKSLIADGCGYLLPSKIGFAVRWLLAYCCSFSLRWLSKWLASDEWVIPSKGWLSVLVSVRRIALCSFSPISIDQCMRDLVQLRKDEWSFSSSSIIKLSIWGQFLQFRLLISSGKHIHCVPVERVQRDAISSIRQSISPNVSLVAGFLLFLVFLWFPFLVLPAVSGSRLLILLLVNIQLE